MGSVSARSQKGSLERPLNIDNLLEDFLLAKRFPVQQKNKVRQIDDYKANMVNRSVTAQSEGIILRTIDHVAPTVTCSLKAVENRPGRSKCWDVSDACQKMLLSDQAYERD